MENIFELSAFPLCSYSPIKTDFLHIRVHALGCIQCDLDSIKTFHPFLVSFCSCKVNFAQEWVRLVQLPICTQPRAVMFKGMEKFFCMQLLG